MGGFLVATINKATRTVDLMDEFESVDENGLEKYSRLIVRNGAADPLRKVYYHYVIEKKKHGESKARGNAKISDFKTSLTTDMWGILHEALSPQLIDLYINTDRCFQPDESCRLRAQNSSNRSGYGSWYEWGECLYEGTLYGETTNYYITGAYISSSPYFNLAKRKVFPEVETKEMCMANQEERIELIRHLVSCGIKKVEVLDEKATDSDLEDSQIVVINRWVDRFDLESGEKTRTSHDGVKILDLFSESGWIAHDLSFLRFHICKKQESICIEFSREIQNLIETKPEAFELYETIRKRIEKELEKLTWKDLQKIWDMKDGFEV